MVFEFLISKPLYGGESCFSSMKNSFPKNMDSEQVDLQLSREPRSLPVMKVNPDVKDIFSFRYEDFTLEGYDPWPAIKAPVAI